MKIITNGKVSPILDFYQLTEKEQKGFDYFDPENDIGDFVRYRGTVYHLGEFQYCPPDSDLGAKGWQGVECQSYFSCIIFKYAANNPESYVIMGRAHW